MKDAFTPDYKLELAQGVVMEVYPPRILSRDGVSAATREGGDDDFVWRSVLGDVQVDCHVQRQANRWEITLRSMNAGPDTEVAIRYPVVYYRFPEGTPLREFDPNIGGVLEKRSLWVERWYPGEASAIDYSHSKGGRTFLYTNFISAGDDSQAFRKETAR